MLLILLHAVLANGTIDDYLRDRRGCRLDQPSIYWFADFPAIPHRLSHRRVAEQGQGQRQVAFIVFSWLLPISSLLPHSIITMVPQQRSCGSIMQQSRLALCLLAFLALISPLMQTVQAFNVYVSAKDQQCFFDHVYAGDKVVISYMVTEGGNNDIDLRVIGPDGKTVYEKERSQEGRLQFKAMQEGTHTLCLDNRMSTVSGKVVAFNLYVGDQLHKHDAAKEGALSPLELAVVSTSEGMNAMRDAIYYAKMREQRHAETVDSTNTRVILWNALRMMAILAMTATQLLLLRGMFEKKRKF